MYQEAAFVLNVLPLVKNQRFGKRKVLMSGNKLLIITETVFRSSFHYF